MSIINVTNLSFAHDGSPDMVFENVSFQLDTDWKLGFIGRNGRGKTTFLNLLQGKYEYSGRISTAVQFDYFPYAVYDKEEYTIDVLREVAPECQDWEIYRELSLLRVDEDVLYRPFSTLSNGEQTKSLLAALFLKQNNFLLIDEPTNHLDMEARQLVGDYLRKKKGFILVSHDRALLDNCADHILSINRTNIEVQKGNFSSWYENKYMQEQFELAQNEKLKKDINRLSTAAKRSADWSDKVESSKFNTDNSGSKIDRGYVGHKAAKMMKRSKTLEARQQSAIDEKKKLLQNAENEEKLLIQPIAYHSDRLVELKQGALFYEDRMVCGNINLSVNQGDRIWLRGKNGCGKSSLLKLINGSDITCTGELYIASGLKISYVSQDTSHLKGNLSDYAERLNIDETIFKTVLRKMDFERSQFTKDMSDFSEGQKKKVLIAGSLCEKAHLYIWDEPLNFIDIYSRMQIEKLLCEFTPTMIFVEHDAAFSENIATKTIDL